MAERKMTLKRMQLAKTGTFGADGREITLQDLRDVYETFDGKGPVSLGHQMTKADWWPSWGNVEVLYLVEDPDGVNAILEGDVSMFEEIAQAIDEGFYPGWSLSIPPRAEDGRRYLHHLALLGSVPPAIRDLEVIEDLGNPENSISASGEGTDFADHAYYNFSDFPKLKPQQKPAKKKAATHQNDFSDDPRIAKLEARAKQAYGDGVKKQILAEVGGLFPVGKHQELCNFADHLINAHDYDFADEGEGKTLCDLFIELIKSANPKGRPATGKSDFSDLGKHTSQHFDRQSAAMKF